MVGPEDIAEHLMTLAIADQAKMEQERAALVKRGSKDLPSDVGSVERGQNLSAILGEEGSPFFTMRLNDGRTFIVSVRYGAPL